MSSTYKVLMISFFAFLCSITTINANVNSNSEDDKNPQHFVVYYDGDLTKLQADKNSYLLSFLEAYDLKLVNTFEIDEHNRGFTLFVENNGTTPADLARELSMIDGVVMVEIVKENPIKSES